MKKFISTLILIVILLFTACSNTNKTDIKIGLIADLTGPMALYGNWVKNGVDIAKAQDNNNCDLVVEDSKSEPKSAVSALQKLTTSGVNFIIAGNGSSAIMSIAPIANKNHDIIFVCLASSPSISEAGPYVFRNRVSGFYEIKSLVDFSIEQQFTNFGALALNNESGMPYLDAFENQLKVHGEKLLSKQMIDAKQSDLSSLALKFKNSAVKTILLSLQAPQAVNFINQCTEINYFPIYLGVSSLKSDAILQLPDKIKYHFYVASEDIDLSNPKYKTYNDLYVKKHNENAGIYAVNGYDAYNILCKLIKENKGDVEKVKAALHKLQFTGAGGSMTFDQNGDANRTVQIFKIEQGEFVKN